MTNSSSLFKLDDTIFHTEYVKALIGAFKAFLLQKNLGPSFRPLLAFLVFYLLPQTCNLFLDLSFKPRRAVMPRNKA